MAEICCGKYHRIRKWTGWGAFEPETRKELYKKYYQKTGEPEVKFILDNVEQFKKLCYKSFSDRRDDDDFAPYRNTKPSTSRDPYSDEWKSGC